MHLRIIAILLLLTFTKLKSQTVYISESGKKYHTKNCSVAKTGKKGIELNEALKRGFEGCKVCNPATSKATQKPKEAESSRNKTQTK